MQTTQLESKIEQLLDNPTGKTQSTQWDYKNFNPQQGQIFAEHDGFSQGMIGNITQVQGGNLLVIVLGAIMSSTIAGIFNRFLPLGSLSGVVGAIALRYFFKSGKGRDFANGVLIGAVSAFVAPMVGGLTSGLGGMFGEDRRRAVTVPSAGFNGGRAVMQ